jgi:hypothetical protein
VTTGTTLLGVIRAPDDAAVAAADAGLRSATLDDAFLTLTGHATADLEEAA